MKLVKETYIHNRLFFDEKERDILCSTVKIISAVRDCNLRGFGSEDINLTKICNEIINNIPELLDKYSNDYPKKEE